MRAFATQYRSLPMYLVYAAPYTGRGSEPALAALRHIVADQEQMAQRIGDLLVQNFGRIESVGFPMEYTALHDLALEYLVKRTVAAQGRDIRTLEGCVVDAAEDAAARSLCEEALGAARAHLDSLEELVGAGAGKRQG